MKVFVADNGIKGYINSNTYNWCLDNEIVIFGQFQLNNNPSSISMVGIESRLFTTEIIVKDININIDFYKEIISESIEKAMDCKIDDDGKFSITIFKSFDFNINDIVDELIEKASKFNDGQIVKCIGKDLNSAVAELVDAV